MTSATPINPNLHGDCVPLYVDSHLLVHEFDVDHAEAAALKSIGLQDSPKPSDQSLCGAHFVWWRVSFQAPLGGIQLHEDAGGVECVNSRWNPAARGSKRSAATVLESFVAVGQNVIRL